MLDMPGLIKKQVYRVLFIVFLLVAIALSTIYALGSDQELSNPTPYVSDDFLELTSSSLIVNLSEMKLVQYADTGSMEPVLFAGATGIEVPVHSPEELHVGDIVSYEAGWIGGLVTHRIVEIGENEGGLYYVLKGDTNSAEDPEWVRFNQVKYRLVGVLY
ncbi:signal peptidase I [Candidatus Woesearchaeota archaeon]|nr:signal peptidase I [Candidatus Woesearchaeota archaeon]